MSFVVGAEFAYEAADELAVSLVWCVSVVGSASAEAELVGDCVDYRGCAAAKYWGFGVYY